MKTTVLAAALLTAFTIPALAGEDAGGKDKAKMTYVDPATTGATTADQSELRKASVKKHGCMHRQTSLEMM